MSATTEQGLWPFALQVWKTPGVERLGIALQDSFGLSVCLLFGGLWLARAGLRPDPGLATRMRDSASNWEPRIASLRQQRRLAASQPAWAEWKQRLQDAELEAERLLLDELHALISEQPLAHDAAQPGHAWLLLLVPDMASCEALAADLETLCTLVLSDSRDRERM